MGASACSEGHGIGGGGLWETAGRTGHGNAPGVEASLALMVLTTDLTGG